MNSKAAVASMLTLAFAMCASSALAQGSCKQDIALSAQGKPLAGAMVTVCPDGATGAPCAPLSALYTDHTLTVPAANPTTADGLGNFKFCAVPGRYEYQISGSGITTYTVSHVILPCDPSANCTMGTNSAISAFSLNLSGNLAVGGSLSYNGGKTPAAESFSADAVQFVSPNGSDLNDGLSWGTAKATLYAALTSLPGGSVASKLAGAGTVFVTQGSSQAGIIINANSGCTGAGLQILGPADPNAGSIPACWLKETGAVSIIGYGFTSSSNGPAGPTVLISNSAAPGSIGLWLSGVGFRYQFRNLTFAAGIPLRIGVDSNGSRTSNAGAGPTLFQSCSFQVKFNTSALNGPGWDLGPNIIWLWADHVSIDALGQLTYNISSVSRSSNVVTVTTTAAHTLQVNQNVLIGGVTDTSFNGMFAVTGVTSTTFTYAQTGVNGSSSGGTAGLAPGNDNRAAILYNTTGGGGSGLIYVQNAVFNGGGGVRFYPPPSGQGSFYLQHVEEEGAANSQPVFEGLGAMGGTNWAIVDDVAIADSGDNPPYVRVASGSTPDGVYVRGGPGKAIPGIEVEGPATIENTGVYGTPTPAASTATNVSPLGKGQIGSFLNRSLYQTDAQRRSFGPAVARFLNSSAQLPSSWTTHTGTVSITSGQTAPDGTANAGLVSSTADGGSGFSDVETFAANHTFAVGDYILAGVWVRRNSTGGVYFNQINATMVVDFPFASGSNITITPGYAVYAANSTNGHGTLRANAQPQDDGAWQWIYTWARVATTDGSGIGVHMQLRCKTTQPMVYYAPILLFVSGLALNTSDSEAGELALAMASWPDDVSAGPTAATLRGVSLAFGGSGNFHGILTHANTANRTYTFPDAAGNVVLDSATQTLSSKTFSSPILSGHLNQPSANGDIAGQISISAATNGSHTFSTAYSAAPVCVASPTSNPGSATWWVTASTTAVTVNLSASSTITFNYACKGNPN